MTFDEYKRVADTIGFRYDTNIQQNAVIYGKYFSQLANAIGKMNYISNQCNTCNATCNVCETCETCDNEGQVSCGDCQYCDWCDAGCCEPADDEEEEKE
jgi:hypothetical protein